jgi:hypothetical protein
MPQTGPGSRRIAPRSKGNHIPWWLLLSLAFLLGIVLYGALTPSPPSAFDRPEAQVNPPRNPWDTPHSF